MSNKNRTKEELDFHEDDYLQLELIPEANIFEKGRVIGETEITETEYGFINARIRKEHKITTLEKRISIDQIIAILENNSLVKFLRISSGYGSIKSIKQDTIGYGFEDYAVLCDFSDQFVKNIWIVFSPKLKMPFSSYSHLTKALYELGTRFNLILIDWNEELIVNLKSKESIQKHFNSI